MLKHLVLIAFLCGSTVYTFAQRPRFGIKAGLNVSSFLGGAEQNSSGTAADHYEAKTGFQVGMSVAQPINDIFGVQAEFLYTQRGGKYVYQDKGFFTFVNRLGVPLETQGDLRVILVSTNSYIEVPFLVYVKPVKSLKVELGVSPMFLLSSVGAGEFLLQNRTYTPPNSLGRSLSGDLSVILQYDYIKDGAAQPNINNIDQTTDIGGDTYTYANKEGAYYNNAEKPSGENLYKFFDLGANLGVSYTFGSGLSFNLRGSYGLLDATNNRYDRRYGTSTGSPDYKVAQSDRDIRNFNVGATIGFSF